MSASASPSLAKLQRQFIARLRGEPDGALTMEVDCGNVSRRVGLTIYTHAYAARLRETLEHDHPVLGSYLGDALWDDMCRGYIDAHPSRVRSLRDFGANLPDFLAQADAFRTQPQIAELALFERRLLDSFDAPDDTHAEWDALIATPAAGWPTLRVRFHPSLRLHQVGWNSVDIWRAIKNEMSPPAAHAATSCGWALWRDRERVGRFRSLDAEESAALALCRSGGDFAQLCESLTESHAPESVPQVALGYLHTWCAEGWIAR
jgi:hypothetical protein